MTYRPKPIATDSVTLPGSLATLTERLAENTHDVWACQRLADGWKHGRQRDDNARTHPGLVPYDELDEVEKTYDRRTVVETLKAILVLGYRILPPVVEEHDVPRREA